MKPFPIRKVADFSTAVVRPFQGRWDSQGLDTLIGDAAHTMPAARGQSSSQAFEDAVVLTQILATEHSVPQA